MFVGKGSMIRLCFEEVVLGSFGAHSLPALYFHFFTPPLPLLIMFFLKGEQTSDRKIHSHLCNSSGMLYIVFINQSFLCPITYFLQTHYKLGREKDIREAIPLSHYSLITETPGEEQGNRKCAEAVI